MIPLVAPTITNRDRNFVAARAWDGRAFNETTVAEFEAAFAERVGCVGAVAVCSATSAHALAFEVLKARPSAPSYACSAVYNALPRANDVRLVDSTFDVREAQMTQDRGAMIVHSFGRETLARRIVNQVEDYTLSLGAIPTPNPYMRVGVCSTHASKMISTGRGGVVFSNDTALLDEVRALAYYDMTPNGNLGAYSLGMSSMQAALGISQLRQQDQFIERRREIAATYSARFYAAGIECPDPYCGSVFFRYLIGVKDPAAKVEALKQAGVEAGRGVYPPLHRQLGMSDERFPGATACVNRLLSVPCHPSLSDADVAFVAEAVVRVCAP